MENSRDAVYVNVSDSYGDEVVVTVADYQELNPGGIFEIVGNEIWEFVGDKHYTVAKMKYDN